MRLAGGFDSPQATRKSHSERGGIAPLDVPEGREEDDARDEHADEDKEEDDEVEADDDDKEDDDNDEDEAEDAGHERQRSRAKATSNGVPLSGHLHPKSSMHWRRGSKRVLILDVVK